MDSVHGVNLNSMLPQHHLRREARKKYFCMLTDAPRKYRVAAAQTCWGRGAMSTSPEIADFQLMTKKQHAAREAVRAALVEEG